MSTTEKMISKYDISNVPILVICQSCGAVYDFSIAKGQCPICGSNEHKSVVVNFQMGGEIMEVDDE